MEQKRNHLGKSQCARCLIVQHLLFEGLLKTEVFSSPLWKQLSI